MSEETCGTCKGDAWDADGNACPTCNGSGVIVK